MKSTDGRPPNLDEETRRELGIEKPAPRGLKDAIEALKKDEAVKTVLGKELWERFIRYKENEERHLAKFSLQERRKLTMEVF